MILLFRGQTLRSTIFKHPLQRQIFANTPKRLKSYKIQTNIEQVKNLTDHHNSTGKRFFTKRRILIGSIIGIGVFYYETNENVHSLLKHIYLLSKRVGIVANATIRCFYYYKQVLNIKFETNEERLKALSECHLRCANITLRALEKNGGIFIKLGQHVSAMTYVLPPEWTQTMIPLQDRCPESTVEEIDSMFAQDLKLHIDEIFEKFNSKPIGVASLAQVHTAVLKETGEKVAIKCQHPSLKEFIPIDIMLTQTVFNLLDIVFPEYPLTFIGDELQTSIYVETDFIKEAKNAVLTEENFKNYKKQTALRIPKVIAAYKRILIMEYITGNKLDDLKFLEENNISRSEVSSCLSHIFNRMIFTPNIGVHCDPHGGNLAIRLKPQNDLNNPHNFEIILFDHGLYRYPSTELRRDYAKFWLSLFDHDIEKMKFYAKRFANISDEQFPLFAAAVTGRSIDTVLNRDINSVRSQAEIDEMTEGILTGQHLSNLMSILSTIPRIVLLILKTNDLTRYLDESLHNPLGPERTFLIMSQYCAKLIFDESIEENDELNQIGSIKWIFQYVKNWIKYEIRINKLFIYDTILWIHQHFNRLSI